MSIEKLAKAVTFYVFLRPLIVVNYWLRECHLIADRWFWADAVAFGWGYVVDIGDK